MHAAPRHCILSSAHNYFITPQQDIFVMPVKALLMPRHGATISRMSLGERAFFSYKRRDIDAGDHQLFSLRAIPHRRRALDVSLPPTSGTIFAALSLHTRRAPLYVLHLSPPCRKAFLPLGLISFFPTRQASPRISRRYTDGRRQFITAEPRCARAARAEKPAHDFEEPPM